MFHCLFHGLAQPQDSGHPALSCEACGRLAQWLEHFLDTEGVGGSSPLSPTCSGPKALFTKAPYIGILLRVGVLAEKA